ncbi:hypothetical protein Tco_0654149 [Tanacetum coccineum]|uniref:Gag-Pol polyprotein n=1 Tax=Tanacetum coccineum TaxID=301880 RepID=A0ABQ4X390_9ASTR
MIYDGPRSSIRTRFVEIHPCSSTIDDRLATVLEMCMFADYHVSIVEPKNIKEAMADSAWIEAMQDELTVRQTKVWE